MKKYLSSILIGMALVGYNVRPAHAIFVPKVNVCHNGETLNVALASVAGHLIHGDQLGSCPEEEPEEPTPSPSPEPSIEPSPEPSPSPEVSPEPSVEPESTPSATPTPADSFSLPSGVNVGWAGCTNEAPSKIANFNVIRTSPFTAKAQWSLHSGDNTHIIYGETGQGWKHAGLNLGNSGEVTIWLLMPGRKYDWQAIPMNGCKPGERSDIKTNI
jgi:hypothetical protein